MQETTNGFRPLVDAGNLTVAEVANIVRPYVEKHTVGSITLSVDDSRIQRNHGYWRVPIRPSTRPKPLFPFLEVLADIEEEIQEGEGLRIAVSSGEALDEI